MSKFRGLMAGIIACVAFLVAASSASALTVSPTGNYTVESGDTQLTLTSNGQALTCDLSSIVANIAANGTGTIPTGNVTYSGCNNSLLGRFTVTQTAGWSLVTTLSAGRLDLVVTVPSGGVSISGAGCVFEVAGTVTLSKAIGALPATVADAAVSSSSLRITRNNGGFTCFAFPVNLAATYTGGYDFDRSATVSG